MRLRDGQEDRIIHVAAGEEIFFRSISRHRFIHIILCTDIIPVKLQTEEFSRAGWLVKRLILCYGVLPVLSSGVIIVGLHSWNIGEGET